MKMATATYICTVIFAVLCFFVIFSSEHNDERIITVTQHQFDYWNCSKVCTNPALKRKLPDVCVALWKKIHVEQGQIMIYSYDEVSVRSTAKCLENAQVDLLDDRRRTKTFAHKMGLCYFDAAIQKCVSKSVDSESTIYYYEYNSETHNCHSPKEMQYELTATTGETILAYIRKWCLGGR